MKIQYSYNWHRPFITSKTNSVVLKCDEVNRAALNLLYWCYYNMLITIFAFYISFTAQCILCVGNAVGF